MDTKVGKWWWDGGGGVMDWAIGMDMYTLMCIKLMTNKNLLYTEINKIKFKNKTKCNKNKRVTIETPFSPQPSVILIKGEIEHI